MKQKLRLPITVVIAGIACAIACIVTLVSLEFQTVAVAGNLTLTPFWNVYAPVVMKSFNPQTIGTPTSTSTTSQTPTPTSTPTNTSTPTATPTSTPTPTVTPCASVSGNISTNTTWRAGCLIVVSGPVFLEFGNTLTIEPGVTVRFDGNYDLWISGRLVAQGTEFNPIRFTSGLSNPIPGNWKEIRLHQTEYSHKLSFVIIEYAQTGIVNNAGLGTLATTIDHSTIRLNSTGISSQKPISISDSIFEGNGTAFSQFAHYLAQISNSVFERNVNGVLYYGTSGGIQIQATTFLSNTNALQANGLGNIQYSTFRGNTGSVVQVYQGINFSNNVLSNNHSSGYVLNIDDTNSTIESNLIEHNSSATAIVRAEQANIGYSRIYNTIAYNEVPGGGGCIIHFDRSGGAYPNEPNLSYSNIISNTATYSACMQFRITNGDAVWPTNNYWGTADSAAISQQIYDFYDDHTWGYVVYEPYATSLVAQAPTPSP